MEDHSHPGEKVLLAEPHEPKPSSKSLCHPVSKPNSFWPIKKSPRQNSAERLCRFKYFGDFCVDVCDNTFSNTTTFKSLPQALHKAQGCTWLPSFYLTILNLSHHLQCAGVHLGLVPPTQHLQGCSHLLYSQHWMVQSALQTEETLPTNKGSSEQSFLSSSHSHMQFVFA